MLLLFSLFLIPNDIKGRQVPHPIPGPRQEPYQLGPLQILEKNNPSQASIHISYPHGHNLITTNTRQTSGSSCVNLDITLTPNPTQPRQKVLLDLSIISIRLDYTSETHSAVLQCLSKVTETELEAWGTRGSSCFAPQTRQVELYVNIAEERLGPIMELTDTYIRDGNLSSCVQKEGLLNQDGKIVPGRTIVVNNIAGIVASPNGAPGWIIGLLLFLLLLVACVVLIMFACRKPVRFDEEQFNRDEGWIVSEEEREIERRERENRLLQKDLKMIAGQREELIEEL